MKILESTTANTMTETFTDDQIVEALLALNNRSVPKKKQRKTILKEKRIMAVKAWHAKQAKKGTNYVKRSTRMIKWWADRKTAEQQTK